MAAILFVQGNQDTGVDLNANATNYGAPLFQWESDSTEANTKVPFNKPGVIYGLQVYVSANSVTAATTVRIRKNGSNGNCSVSIGSSATGQFTDTSHSDVVSAGDLINIQRVAGATGTAITFRTLSYVFSASTDTAIKYGSSSSSGVAIATASVTRYMKLTDVAAITTESDAKYKFNTAGTLSRFGLYVSANARVNTTTFNVRKNAGDGNQSISVGSGATGLFEDTSNTDSVADDDQINFAWTTSTGTQTLTLQWIGVEFVTTNNKFNLFNSGQTIANNASTDYWAVGGNALRDASNENNAKSYAGITGTVSNFWVNVTANTFNAATAFTFRLNGGDQSLAISVTSGATGQFEDSSHTINVRPFDQIDFSTIESASSGSFTSGGTGFLFENKEDYVSPVTYTVTGKYYWLCPDGVTSVDVELWGGGGGGAAQGNPSGGGGGAYSKKTVTVTPGNVYLINVGYGGPEITNGEDSYFYDTSTVLAKGGSHGDAGGQGGQASDGVGTTKYSGGNGFIGGNYGGGGGSSAGTASNGNDGTDYEGGTAPSGGGDGGDGENEDTFDPPLDGSTPGGGGGGSYDYPGASGAAGQARLTWSSGGGGTLTPSVSDTVTVSESITIQLVSYVNKSDTVTITESIQMMVIDNVSVFDSVSIIENITVNINTEVNVFDSVTITEAVTVLIPVLYVSVFDTVSVSEALQEDDKLLPSVFDAVSITENLTVRVNLEPQVYDTVTISEFVGYYDDTVFVGEYINIVIVTDTTTTVSVSDDVSVSESINVQLVSYVNVFDTVTVTEATQFNGVLYISVSDSVSVTESITAQLVSYVAVNDTVTVTEAITVQLISYVNVFDAVSITEVVTVVIPTLVPSVFDTVSVTESVTLILVSYVNVSDTVTVTESIQMNGVSYPSVSDTVTVTESITVQIVSYVNVFDAVTITENVTVLIPVLYINVFDTVSVIDTPSFSTGTTLIISVVDTVTVDESISVNVQTYVSVFDTVSISEDINVQLASYINKFDTVTITESVQMNKQSYVSVSDNVTITENLTVKIPTLVPSVSDDVGVTESVTVLIPTLKISVFDTVSITESTQLNGQMNRSVFDTVTITENLTVRVNLLPQVSDTVSITESITMRGTLYISVFEEVAVSESTSFDYGGTRTISVSESIGVSEYVSFEIVDGEIAEVNLAMPYDPLSFDLNGFGMPW